MSDPLRIVAAAVLLPDGKIFSRPPPARHDTLLIALWERGHRQIITTKQQGFLGSDGTFIERLEAGRIAIAAGQIAKLRWPPQLYSEDLW